MSNESKPWEQQQGESAKAFAAFVVFRDLGVERTLVKVFRVLRPGSAAKTSGQVGRWSVKWKWVARAIAWDAEVDRLRREARVRKIIEMNDRQASYALVVQAKGMRKLSKLTDAQIESLEISEALAMFEKGVKAERIARGEATEVVKQESKVEHTISDKNEFENVPIEKLMALDEAIADVLSAADPKAATKPES